MDAIDAVLMEAHCNLVIKRRMQELEHERLLEQADILFDQEENER
jgi:hypothetical protein